MRRVRNRKSRPSARKTRGERIGGVLIGNSDKVLWPAFSGHRAVLKRDLAAYLAVIAPRMLPHVARRPLSLVRAPDGIGGKWFFQRHPFEGAAAPLLAIRASRGGRPFVGVGNARGLLALAQAGALEIHPWGSVIGDPGCPERIIFDLDPGPGADFTQVVEAARAMRKRLRACGLVPFVKTTGGKGLHVVVPVRAARGEKLTWKDARLFAKKLCRAMQKSEPRLYTANPLRSARRGKVYLDYLRNAKSATAVAPWSPRARKGAPVAMPLAWSEVRAGLNPAKFTIANRRAIFARANPWTGLGRSARSLARAMRKLEAQEECA